MWVMDRGIPTEEILQEMRETLSSFARKGTPMTSLQQKLNQLNLTTMSQHVDETLADAASKNLSTAGAFEALLDRELEARHTRSIDRRLPARSFASQALHRQLQL